MSLAEQQRPRQQFLSTLSFRLMLAAVLVVLIVTGVVHVLWRSTAESNVNDVVVELNQEILQGVGSTVRGVSEDVLASQQLLRHLFRQGLLQTVAAQDVAPFFGQLLLAKPLYTWVQIGFANGDFWGMNRDGDGSLRLVVRRWNASQQKAQRTITAYHIGDGELRAGSSSIAAEDYFAPARPWFKAALDQPGEVVWSDVYLFATSGTPGIDSAQSLTLADGQTMVLGIGFELKRLSYYLGKLPVAARGRVFIMNGDARVVASSDTSLARLPAQRELELPRLADLPDPLLRIASTTLATQPSAGEPRQGFTQYRTRADDGLAYYVTLQATGYEDWILGTVIPEQIYLERIDASRLLLLWLLAGFALFTAIVVAWLGRRWIGQPIAALTTAARSIQQGNFDVRLPLAGYGEIAQLGQTFNYMAASLKEREHERDIFGRVVSPEVREKMLAGQLQLGGETCWVSVIFSDIRGFSSFSEKMDPQEVVSLLNEYMSEMSQAVTPWGAYINNFIGDAIVVVFGAPITRQDTEWCAVNAALAMRAGLHRLNARRRAQGKIEIRSGIGISTGDAVAGQIGSLERLLYTVIGDAVNIAARLETMTKDFPGNPILISEQTAAALSANPAVKLTDLGVHPIKGRLQELRVFALDEETKSD